MKPLASTLFAVAFSSTVLSSAHAQTTTTDTVAVASTSLAAVGAVESAGTPPAISVLRDQAAIDTKSRVPTSDLPLASVGRVLNDAGIHPTLSLVQFYLANPSLGEQTGNHEILTMFNLGFDLDLQKLAGVPGSKIHFQQLLAPVTSNTGYGGQVGDAIAGQSAPYLARKAHLTLFTLEQDFLGDRVEVEFGKSNAGNYFALPVCNQPFGCTSPLLQENAAFNPPIYANWGGRVQYKFTPAFSVQAGMWQSHVAAPFTSGWEWSPDTPVSQTYLANIAYRTDAANDAYAKSYEFLFFHNTASQTDPYYTVNGLSKFVDTTSASATHKGTSGLYAGGKQVFYRFNNGGAGSDQASLSAFGSVTSALSSTAASGLQTSGNAGLAVQGLFASRPADSYAIKATWVQLTSREQRYLQGASSSTATVGRNEYGLGVDANFVLTRSIIVSPFALRAFHANNWQEPITATRPRNGYAYGVLCVVLLDKMVGLSE
ncbi:MAG: carbohydrate porin [Janthinobacterium lividum]